MSAYASAASDYWARQWRGILPVPPAQKNPPPTGFTGHDGTYPAWPDIQEWIDTGQYLIEKRDGQRVQMPVGNIALRLPNTVIGVDVDHYDGKRGGDTLAEAERRWGPLPPTWRSTSRNDGISGIRLYRIEAGVQLETKISFDELGLGGIEIVQSFHRFTVCWPSVHDKTGRTYRWLDHQGMDTDIPRVEKLPNLPSGWVEGLARRSSTAITTSADVDQALGSLTDGAMAPGVKSLLAHALTDLMGGNAASRHDITLRNVLGLIRASEEGQPGVKAALQQLEDAFVTVVGKDRGRDAARLEYRRMVEGQRGHDLIASSPSVETLFGLKPNHSEIPNTWQPAPPQEVFAEYLGDDEDDDDPDDDIVWDLLGESPPVETGSDTTNRTSWGLVDIRQVLSADYEPEMPTELARADGKMMFYPGRVNGLVGEPESAKSWLIQLGCVQALLAGRKVIYIDFEDMARNVVNRLILMGAPKELVEEGFGYIEPDGPMGPVEQEELFAALDSYDPAIVVVDGVNAAMQLFGLAMKDNDDYGAFHSHLLKPLARRGAAVVFVDHVTKDRGTRGGYAIGAQSKKALADGAVFGVSAKIPFGKGRTGELEIIVLKDKLGGVRENAEQRDGMDYFASVSVDATHEGEVRFVVFFREGGAKGDGKISDADAALVFMMDKVSRFMEAGCPEDGLTSNAIVKEIPGRKADVVKAVAQLVDRGCLSVAEGPRRSRLHRFERAYVVEADDLLMAAEE